MTNSKKHHSHAHSHVDWHSAFCSGLQMDLLPFEDFLSYHPEYLMNKGQRRADCLVIKSLESPPLTSPVTRLFRRYNLFDYKGPHEHMNVSNFFKACSYAFSLPDFLQSSNAVNEVTLTLVTHSYPRALFSYLREKSPENTKDPIEKAADGLYHILKGYIPMQVIVLPQLSAKEYLWLRCLTNRLTPDMPFEDLERAYLPHQDDPRTQDYMAALLRANFIEEGREMPMTPKLQETLNIIMAEDLKAREERGMKRGLSQGLSQGLRQGADRVSALIRQLLSENRSADIERVASDSAYRDALLEKYDL